MRLRSDRCSIADTFFGADSQVIRVSVMRHLRMRLIATILLLQLLLGCASAPESEAVRVNFRAGFGSESDGLAAAWLGYALARLGGDRNAGVRAATIDPAAFPEEAHARESMALIWGELAERDGLSNTYLEDLVKIQKSGFLREYTWRCVLNASNSAGLSLKIDDFENWMRRELPEHHVETLARVVLREEVVVAEVGWAIHEPRACRP
ncbi:MAG: hypothetical protein R3F35_11620 [Myxococcota bacterium]